MTAQEAFLAEYGALVRKHGMFVTNDIYDDPQLCEAVPEYVEEHLKKLDKEERLRQKQREIVASTVDVRAAAIVGAAEELLKDCGNLDKNYRPQWPAKCGHLACCAARRKALCELVRAGREERLRQAEQNESNAAS